MAATYDDFSLKLVKALVRNKKLEKHATDAHKLQIAKNSNETVCLDLTPFVSKPQPVTARECFFEINSVDGLFNAYRTARNSLPFEKEVVGAYDHVSDYADQYLEKLFIDARNHLADTQAAMIANWVCELDIYAAVKAVESLLNSHADIALLMLSDKKGWDLHFDHMAIRCGSSSRQDAERVMKLLCHEHGYVASQVAGENYYQFPDGWNAYPLYKILENGQVLRVFVDQSAADHPEQIIQHWNHVYGYTAHHLAMRATKVVDGQRVAIGLNEIIKALNDQGVESMAPTGMYTEGLLEQVFTRPEKNAEIPQHLLDAIIKVDAGLQAKIGNGKLLELVSRKEVKSSLAKHYFSLYDIDYDALNPRHSVPAYQYFLPAQASHVIKTSIEI